MAAYDSDSSGGEDNDYTETNVLLGYASKEPQDDTITHLGGQPVSRLQISPCLKFLRYLY
jgi:pre-rRNA-processing protein TSR4